MEQQMNQQRAFQQEQAQRIQIQQALLEQARQAQIQQALQQEQARHAQIQRALQNQAIQEQARQEQERFARTQQILQQQAIENVRLQQIQTENRALPSDGFNSQSYRTRDYIAPNKPRGRNLYDFQPENVRDLEQYPQEFIDEIVRKVMQETRGEFAVPTTREDIEKIVRKILLENNSDKRNELLYTNRINGHQDNLYNSNSNQNNQRMNTNQNSLSEAHDSEIVRSMNYQTEKFNPEAECIFNCVNSQDRQDGQPIAVAIANSFHPLHRSPSDPRMIANSFTYTSV